MLKCVIFDLDGVLVSTDEYHYHAWKVIAEELGIPFNREDNMRQRGVSRMESLEVILEKTQKCFTQEEKISLADKKNAIYIKSLHDTLNENCILDGVLESLNYLKSCGILIAVGSSSCNAPFIIEKTELSKYIDIVVSGLDIKHSKPHPEVFMSAQDKSGFSSYECLVVEDAETGVKAGLAAGMRVLAVGAAYKNKNANYRAKSLGDTSFSWESILNSFSKVSN